MADDPALAALGVRVVHARLAHEGDFFRHDSAQAGRRRAAPGADRVSFTQDVKRELAAIVPAESHCARAQLAGLLFAAGTFEIASGGQYTVRVSSRLPAVARSVLSLLRPMGAHAELRTADTPPAGLRYEVVLGDDPRHLQVLNEAGVLSDSFQVQLGVPARIVARRCCRVAFARGAFLGCGSISPPGSAVHAEFTFESGSSPRTAAACWLGSASTFASRTRDRNAACYTKRGETAADLLAVLGAHSGAPGLGGAPRLRRGPRARQPPGQLRPGQRRTRRARRPASDRDAARRSWPASGWAARAGRAAQPRRAAAAVTPT